jgi:hypothetical protein
LRAIEVGGARVARRRAAVAEIRNHLAGLYRGFVWWTSLHGEVDEGYERENRERVVGLLDDLSNQYFPRSVWLTEGSRKKVENYVRMSEGLCSEFSAEIEQRGYPRVRRSMERRVSKKLRPLKTEAESGLEAELAEPRPGWRERLRRPWRAYARYGSMSARLLCRLVSISARFGLRLSHVSTSACATPG